MDVGLYNEPINITIPNYKGLYRWNGIVELMESNYYDLQSAVEWFFSVSREGSFLKYNEENWKQLLKLHSVLKDKNWMGDIVLFTDCCGLIAPSGFTLLGYDICSDSKYYSPLGDGFLQNNDKGNVFFIDMSIYEFERFRSNINEVGLFNTYSTALDFSKYCNLVNEKNEHAVESETNWRPFAIYSWTGDRDKGTELSSPDSLSCSIS